MHLLPARTYPRLYAVLLALGLILAGLQQVSAQPVAVVQHNDIPASLLSQHTPSHYEASQCAADCISTLQHCCLYALQPTQLLSISTHKPSYFSWLTYFSSSRQITPQTPPPKTA